VCKHFAYGGSVFRPCEGAYNFCDRTCMSGRSDLLFILSSVAKGHRANCLAGLPENFA